MKWDENGSVWLLARRGPIYPRRPRPKALELLHILREDGLSYGDYFEQVTSLLFPKMANEQSRPRSTPSAIPAGKNWPSLLAKDGDQLEVHYRHTLEELGNTAPHLLAFATHSFSSLIEGN